MQSFIYEFASFVSKSQNNQDKNLKINFCFTDMEEKHIYSSSYLQ